MSHTRYEWWQTNNEEHESKQVPSNVVAPDSTPLEPMSFHVSVLARGKSTLEALVLGHKIDQTAPMPT
jgi:hypothetical protein